MNIAVIPARGGSKRIPNKNIKEFCGKPIIYWPINVAKSSGLFDKIIVSTDSKEIAKISNDCGAETPFIRPKNISDDFSTTGEVMEHAASWLIKNDLSADYLCCIYPTSVFLDQTYLKKGFEKIKEGKWLYSFSVSEFKSSVYRSFIKSKNGGIKMLFQSHYNTRTQDLSKVYYDVAQFYWSKLSTWKECKKVFDEYSFPIIIPSHRVLDIDTIEEFEKAEILFKSLNCN